MYHLKVINTLDGSYNMFPLGKSGYEVSRPTKEQSLEGADPLLPFVVFIKPMDESPMIYRIPVTSAAEIHSKGEVVESIYRPSDKSIEERITALKARIEEKSKPDSNQDVKDETPDIEVEE